VPADEVFFDLAMRRLSEQIGLVDKLDTKVGTIFTFAAALLPISGALVGIIRAEPPRAPFMSIESPSLSTLSSSVFAPEPISLPAGPLTRTWKTCKLTARPTTTRPCVYG
jgi:hypothetical protein